MAGPTGLPTTPPGRRQHLSFAKTSGCGQVIDSAAPDISVRSTYTREAALYGVIDVLYVPVIGNDRDVAHIVGPVDPTPRHDQQHHR